MLRLLQKSEVDKRKAEEQRQAIQEGLKVAERVDSLREIHASEEVAFEKYRIETLGNIHQEIQEKFLKKTQLEIDVARLQQEKQALLIPLDAKWKEVTEQERIYASWEDDLNQKEILTTSKEVELKKREKDTAVKEKKAEDLKQLASALFSQATTVVATAKEESADMRNQAQAQLSRVEIQEVEVAEREVKNTLHEQLLVDKEQDLKKYAVDLSKREATLRAGWKNLERTAAKLKPHA